MVAEAKAFPYQAHIEWLTGMMQGAGVQRATKTLGQMGGLFHSGSPVCRLEESTVVYRVQWIEPVLLGTEGGLFWGSTIIEAGRVDDEYFMTQGHFHARRDRGECYGTIEGKGLLVLMKEDRTTWTEAMSPGSLHFIAGGLAHRVVNTGDNPLAFWACWPSDAGHDYAPIQAYGFGARILHRDGGPVMVPE